MRIADFIVELYPTFHIPKATFRIPRFIVFECPQHSHLLFHVVPALGR